MMKQQKTMFTWQTEWANEEPAADLYMQLRAPYSFMKLGPKHFSSQVSSNFMPSVKSKTFLRASWFYQQKDINNNRIITFGNRKASSILPMSSSSCPTSSLLLAAEFARIRISALSIMSLSRTYSRTVAQMLKADALPWSSMLGGWNRTESGLISFCREMEKDKQIIDC